MPSRVGLKLVAVLEAAKGLVVLAAGFGLFRLVHRDVQAAAENLVRHLHLDPASHYPRILLDASTWLNDSHLRLLALGALAYSVVRFIEAFGLWTDRGWAEWFAVISGGIYVPVEIFELFRKLTWTRFSILTVNLIVVGYLGFVLTQKLEARRRVAAMVEPESPIHPPPG